MAGSVFDLNGNLAIDFSGLAVDMTTKTLDRLLYQFQNSPVMIDLNTKLVAMEQELYDATVDVMRGRTIAEAAGVNLDVLGDIVGQPRILLNADTKVWFQPDGAIRTDSTPVFMAGAPLFGDLPADDSEFRRLILSKIFKNHVKVGSVPEIIQFINLLAGVPASVFLEGPMDISLALNVQVKPNDVRTIITVFNDKTADRKYLVPLPTTARLINIWYRPPAAFAPDRVPGRCDIAKLSLKVPVSIIESFT